MTTYNTVCTGTGSCTPTSRTITPRCTTGSRAPSRDVVDATEFLLAQSDAYLYRRRYRELIAHTSGPDGTSVLDYTAADGYLLATATALRGKLLRRRAGEEARPSFLTGSR